MLEVKNLKKYFPIQISFTLQLGETLGLVGESGCDKTTTGQLILPVIEPTAGEIWFEDDELGRHNLPTLLHCLP